MSVAHNDGKRLEQLVAFIEGLNLPPGFKVEKNSPVRNEDGVQIAELDILISGVIGTVTHRTLFECRDRPSEGAQGVGWIEQLVGRRQRLHVDTVVAVSTTGFSTGAVEFAKQTNIPLRTVETLTEDDIRGWIPRTAPLLHQDGNFTGVRITVVPEGQTLAEVQSKGGEMERKAIANDEKVFHNINTGEKLSILGLWGLLLKLYEVEIFGDVPWTGVGVEKVIDVREDVRRDFRVVKDGKRGEIVELVFTATIRQYPSQLPLEYCVRYGESMLVAHWKGEGDHNVTMVATKRQPQKRS